MSRDRSHRDGGGPGGGRRGGRDEDHRGGGRIRYGGSARSNDPKRRSAQRPSERSRRSDPARSLAFDAMLAIEEGAYANIDLPVRLRRARLERQDAAFATELVYGATRMRGLYDAIIAVAAARDVAGIDEGPLAAMRLGAHQLLGMRVPAHAAVGETVALTRQAVGTGAAGFVNAVLRRVSERTLAEWIELVAPPQPSDEGAAAAGSDAEVASLAVEHSHPEWVVRALRAALLGHGASTPGTVTDDLVALLTADNAVPTVTLVARPGLSDLAELEDAGATATGLSPYGAALESGGDPGRIPSVRQGRAAVQDEGSQLIPIALVQVPLEGLGDDSASGDGAGDDGAGGDGAGGEPGDAVRERWLELCAGPGGKAGLLAALSLGRDVAVFANEVSEHRTRLVEQAVDAAIDAGAEVYVGTGDGRTLGAEEPGGFDRVLVDAPCTGLGALRRRPEARWRRSASDVPELTGLQGDLLDSAISATRPGGVVAYATCSPHLAETRQVVERILARHPHVHTIDAREYVRDADDHRVSDTGPGPYAQLWPHLHGTDAMFLALLRVGEPTDEVGVRLHRGRC